MEQPKKQWKITDVNADLMQGLAQNAATMQYMAHSYNLGIAIGELVGMDCPKDEILAAVDKMIDQSMLRRKLRESTAAASNGV